MQIGNKGDVPAIQSPSSAQPWLQKHQRPDVETQWALLAQACESQPITAGWVLQEGSFKETELSDRCWIEDLQRQTLQGNNKAFKHFLLDNRTHSKVQAWCFPDACYLRRFYVVKRMI